jgi:integrase
MTQARKLLEAPPPADTLKGVRDRAILATLLYHGMRREELSGIRVRDIQSRQGVVHFRVKGKRDDLGSGVLLAGGDASVADEHDRLNLKVLRRCLIMQCPSAT